MANPFHQRHSAALLASVLVILAALSGQALALSSTPNLAACSAIALDQARLACYDRVSGFAGNPSTIALTSTAMEAPAAPASAPVSAPVAVQQDSKSRSDAQIVVGAESASMIDEAWGFNADSSRYGIDVYRPNYLLLASYASRKNNVPFQSLFDATEQADAEMQSTEAEFQISFKARLWATEDRRFGVWGAYTQLSQWQVYNADLSRPFRETNYMPELMASFRPGLSLGGAHWRLFNFGYAHQSNGRSDPISRSWVRQISDRLSRDHRASDPLHRRRAPMIGAIAGGSGSPGNSLRSMVRCDASTITGGAMLGSRADPSDTGTSPSWSPSEVHPAFAWACSSAGNCSTIAWACA